MRTGVYTFTSSIYALELYWETVCVSNEQLLLHMPMQHSSKLQDPNIPINVNHHNSFLLCNTTTAENKSAPKDTVGSLSCLRRLRRNPASLRVVLPVQRPRPSIHNLSTYSPLTFQNQKIAVAKQNDWIHFHPSVMPKYEESYNLWREPRCFPPKGLLTKILFWQSWGWIQSSWKLQKFGLCFVI